MAESNQPTEIQAATATIINRTTEMEVEKSKKLKRTERIGFIVIMAFIFIFSFYGTIELMLVLLGAAALYKIYVFKLHKKEGLENLFWKNSSKVGFVVMGLIALLAVMDYYRVF